MSGVTKHHPEVVVRNCSELLITSCGRLLRETPTLEGRRLERCKPGCRYGNVATEADPRCIRISRSEIQTLLCNGSASRYISEIVVDSAELATRQGFHPTVALLREEGPRAIQGCQGTCPVTADTRNFSSKEGEAGAIRDRARGQFVKPCFKEGKPSRGDQVLPVLGNQPRSLWLKPRFHVMVNGLGPKCVR